MSKGRWVPGLGIAVRDTLLESEYEEKLQAGGFRLPILMLEFKPNTIYVKMDKSGNYIRKLILVTQNEAYDWRQYDPQRLTSAAAKDWLRELGLARLVRKDAFNRLPAGPNKLLYYLYYVNEKTGEIECHFNASNIAYNRWNPGNDEPSSNWNGWNGRRIAWKSFSSGRNPCFNFPQGFD